MRSPDPARRPSLPRLARGGALASLLVVHGVVVTAACSQKPVTVPLRSLERSGRAALVCLRAPGTPSPGRPLSECSPGTLESGDFTSLPNHAYALVTQTTRGEIAVLDLTTGEVADADAAVPGYTFLPVGAQPVDIAATRGSGAAFVGVAEVNRPGIFALPAALLRGASPSLADFPACALPSRPGPMVVVPAKTEVCEGANYAVDVLRDRGDPAHSNGDLSAEGPQKLIVAMPEDGDFLVIDTQKLLDRKPGSFDPCPIERRQKLAVELPPETVLPGKSLDPECPPVDSPRTPSATCTQQAAPVVSYPTSFTPSPSALALVENKLYVTDKAAPVIHRLDVSDPCAPVELPPLLPTSFDAPYRPIYTSAIAVSPLTHDKKRFAYAVDYEAGSLMAFDVSDTSTSRTPMVRARPDYAPYTPRDRLALNAPVRDVTFVQLDAPLPDDRGNLRSGILCNPDDAAADVSGNEYRTASDFSSGAGPRALRGIFGLAALTNGTMVYIDVDDLDAPCRQYRHADPDPNRADVDALPSWMTGCADLGTTGACGIPSISLAGASDEATCRAVVRHELRSAYHVSQDLNAGNHLPGFLTFPALSLKGSTLRSDAGEEGQRLPKLLGPSDQPYAGFARPGGVADGVTVDPATSEKSFVTPDLAEPRAHVEQDWTLTYEGPLPGSVGKVGRLSVSAPDQRNRGIFDPSGGFCDLGVHDVAAARVRGRQVLASTDPVADTDTPPRASALDAFASAHGDIAEITNGFLAEEDPYWTSTNGVCSYLRCTTTYGPTDAPTAARTFPILEAYQDRILTASTTVIDVTDETRLLPAECCFPTLIRPGSPARARRGSTTTAPSIRRPGAASKPGSTWPRVSSATPRS